MSPDYGFYSALDADSEGVEGKFYSFTKAEIGEILSEEMPNYFAFTIMLPMKVTGKRSKLTCFSVRTMTIELAAQIGIPVDELLSVIKTSKEKLLAARSKRIRPGLDNKILASWNGLMLKGLTDAYRAFDVHEYLDLALKNAQFITDNLITMSGKLIRIYKTPASSTGSLDEVIAFLDDYANVIDGFIGLYESTFDIQWLNWAKKLTDITIAHYYDQEQGIFFYTGDGDEQLIARKSEIMDGVIPSSNSVMARNLKKLGLLFDDDRYTAISAQLLRNIFPLIAKYGSSYSNWATLLQEEVFGCMKWPLPGPMRHICVSKPKKTIFQIK
jgi:uncharacterized protein YyaL (SSP411 family)